MLNVENYNLDNLKTAFEKYINENEKEVVKDETYVNYLVENMTSKNVHHIFKLAEVYNLTKIGIVKDFIILNIEEIIKNNNEFVELIKSEPNYMFDILNSITTSKFNISLKE